MVPVIEQLGRRRGRRLRRHDARRGRRAALEAGARIVNDVSGGLADPEILRVVAAPSVTYVAMHWRAHSDRMQKLAVVRRAGRRGRGVRAELAERVEAALAAGIAGRRLVLDPGSGSPRPPTRTGSCSRGLDEIAALGFPLLVGASRKSLPGQLLADADGAPRPVDEREHANTALTVLLAERGVWGLRVHDVRASRDALRVLARLEEAERPRVTDELAIRGIECFGHHGVFDFERRDGQTFVIDLMLGLDTGAAAASDDLHDTVDYGSLVASVQAAVETDPVDLIETLAQRIADVCLLDDRVEWARVTVHKPDAPIDATFSDVALTITRKT